MYRITLRSFVLCVLIHSAASSFFAQADPPSWTQLSNSGPTPRESHQMVYIPDSNQVLLFGGRHSNGSVSSETWIWNGIQWTQASVSGPSGRYGHAMAYDSIRKKTVLFGGYNNVSTHYGDTWEWDGIQWIQISSIGPSLRMGARMVYDSIRQKTILFGGTFYNGVNNSTFYNETWEWDGSSWTQINNTGPSVRKGFCFVFDPLRNVSSLFAGYIDPPQYFGDTWELNGHQWTQIASTGPSARDSAIYGYDANRGKMVIFGGQTSNGSANGETWEWGGSNWSQITVSGPTARAAGAMVYNASTYKFIMFGGRNFTGQFFGDTWELDLGTVPLPTLTVTPTLTYTPTPTPTSTPIPTPDTEHEDILAALESHHSMILSTINSRFDNFLCPDINLGPVLDAIGVNNNLIQSESQNLHNSIAASRSDIGQASASLHHELDSLQNQLTESTQDLNDAINSIEFPPFPTDDILQEIGNNRNVVSDAQTFLDGRITQIEGQLGAIQADLSSTVAASESSLQSALNQANGFILSASDSLGKKVDGIAPGLANITNEINQNETLISARTNQILNQLQNQSGQFLWVGMSVQSVSKTIQQEIHSSKTEVLSGLDEVEQHIGVQNAALESSLTNRIDSSRDSILNTLGAMQTTGLSLLPEIGENQAKIAEATMYLDARIHETESSLLSSLNSKTASLESANAALVQTINDRYDNLSGQVLWQSALIQSASGYLDARVAQLGTGLTIVEQQILNLDARSGEILAEIGQIGTLPDSLVTRLEELANDHSALGGLLIELKTNLHQMALSQSGAKEREIESYLNQEKPLVQLYMPVADGGELENVAALVLARIQWVESKGQSSRNARTYYNKGVTLLNGQKYYDAFSQFSKAYRELTKEAK